LAFLEVVSFRTFFIVEFIFIVGVFLKSPRSFCDSWKFTTVCHGAEADSADAKFLIDSVWATATLATCVTANLELGFTACLHFE
jgi:hypothetical protein